MLRVFYSDTEGVQHWKLSGRLAGPWVDELRSCWRQARDHAPRAWTSIDLKDVVFVDESGATLLAEIERTGAELVAAGVDNRDLISSLKQGADHPLWRCLQDLCRR